MRLNRRTVLEASRYHLYLRYEDKQERTNTQCSSTPQASLTAFVSLTAASINISKHRRHNVVTKVVKWGQFIC